MIYEWPEILVVSLCVVYHITPTLSITYMPPSKTNMVEQFSGWDHLMQPTLFKTKMEAASNFPAVRTCSYFTAPATMLTYYVGTTVPQAAQATNLPHTINNQYISITLIYNCFYITYII